MIKHHAIKKYVGVVVQLYAKLTAMLEANKLLERKQQQNSSSQKTRSISITRTNWLMLRKNHIKHIYRLCGMEVGLLCVKANGPHALKD
jgi:hypothetical protein